MRENQNLIPAFAHNLFSFDFFFVVKGRCLANKTAEHCGNNLTNFQYANIGCQVKFIDTIKYYQQSLSSLAKNANETEKINIRQSCRKFIEKNETYSPVFNSLLKENKNWVLDYFCEGKGVISYEKIKIFDNLDCVSEGEFFTKTEFY